MTIVKKGMLEKTDSDEGFPNVSEQTRVKVRPRSRKSFIMASDRALRKNDGYKSHATWRRARYHDVEMMFKVM